MNILLKVLEFMCFSSVSRINLKIEIGDILQSKETLSVPKKWTLPPRKKGMKKYQKALAHKVATNNTKMIW